MKLICWCEETAKEIACRILKPFVQDLDEEGDWLTLVDCRVLAQRIVAELLRVQSQDQGNKNDS